MVELNGVSYDKMVSTLAKSGKDLMSSMTPIKLHVWHMSSCVMGEVGELVEGYQQRDAENIKEELGDIEFYLQGLRDGVNLTFEDVISFDFKPGVTFVYGIDGLVVAAARVFDACKKWFIYERDIDLLVVKQELARLEFYMRQVRMRAGITREECQLSNMTKLAKRYGPEYGYTNEKAQNRADKVPVRRVIGTVVPKN